MPNDLKEFAKIINRAKSDIEKIQSLTVSATENLDNLINLSKSIYAIDPESLSTIISDKPDNPEPIKIKKPRKGKKLDLDKEPDDNLFHETLNESTENQENDNA